LDVTKVDPEMIKEFLSRGTSKEVEDFVESYMRGIKDALESRMFRDYMLLNMRFAVIGYLESIHIPKEEYMGQMEQIQPDINAQTTNIPEYFGGLLHLAMDIRDRENDDQSRTIIRKATEFIDAHYDEESLSLNEVADYAEVSASYFSAIFSQGMQKTFVEYVTAKRMEKAKKLLRSTENSSSEVAGLCGYKDPHYFSFVFKKTQGMSPREYRNGKK